MLICAGNNEEFSFAKSIGVGLINSSINLTSLILKENVDNLIFIGSAGSYDKNLEIGEIFYSLNATNIEISFSEARSYTPLQNHISLESFIIKNKEFTTKDMSVRSAIVNSSNYISLDSNFAKKMTATGIMLENMEFFSIVSVAKMFNIPCIGVFCVSNYCNKFAHRDFIKNHNLVKDRLIEHINKNFFLFKEN